MEISRSNKIINSIPKPLGIALTGIGAVLLG
jgi:hypothetical protein